MRLILSIVFFGFALQTICGQTWEYTSDGGDTLTDRVVEVEELTDGYIALCNVNGLYHAPINQFHMALVKLDFEGNEVWRKYYDYEHIYGIAIEVTDDGGFLFGATRWSDTAEGLYNKEILIFKTNNLGELEWTKILNDGEIEYQMDDLKLTPDTGGFIVIGSKSQTASPFLDLFHDLYIYKADDNGVMEWDLVIGDEAIGESNALILPLVDGGYIVTCDYGYPAASDYYFLRLDENGEIIWSTFRGEEFRDFPTSIIQAQDGNILVGGHWGTSLTGVGTEIFKLDLSTGDEIWAQTLSGVTGAVGTPFLTLTSDGGFLVACRNSSYLFKYNQNGDEIWNTYVVSTTTGIIKRTFGVKEISDDGFIVFGETFIDSPDAANLLVDKYNEQGVMIGTEEAESYVPNHSLKVFPNPIQNQMTVTSDLVLDENTYIEVCNGLGNVLLKEKYTNNRLTIDLAELPGGIYFLGVYSDDKLISEYYKICKR